ncbi:hypothetical protein Tco_1440501 [Tanacetum coccineum]
MMITLNIPSDDEAHTMKMQSGHWYCKQYTKQQTIKQSLLQQTPYFQISNSILNEGGYDIWAMEMEHYLEYIDNDVWKVIQNGNSKKRISTGNMVLFRIFPRTLKTRFHGMDDAKEIWEAIRTRFGEAGKQEEESDGIDDNGDGIVNWENTLEDEEINHALKLSAPVVRVAKPVWTKQSGLINANKFCFLKQYNLILVNVNSVRPNVNTGRVNVNSVKSNVNTGRTNVNPVRPRVNTGNWGTDVKTSAGYNWRKTRPNSNYDSRSNFVKTVNVKGPQGRPKPVKAWPDLWIVVLRIGKLQGIGEFSGVGFISTRQMSSGDKDSLGDDASKQGRIDIGDINTDAEITLIDETQGRIHDIIVDEDITLIPKLIIKLLKILDVNTDSDPVAMNKHKILSSLLRKRFDALENSLEKEKWQNSYLDSLLSSKDGRRARIKEEQKKRKAQVQRRKSKARKGIGLHTSTELESGEVDITSSKIVKWKILRHGGKGYCHLIRANQRDSVFVNFGAMLHNISRDDLVDLYKIVLRKTTAYGPEEDLERAFAENLRIMFDPPQSEDTVWSLPMHIPIVNWRYYDSCNVHCLNLHNTTTIYMLAERSYPLSEEVCRMMLKKKLFAQNNKVKKNWCFSTYTTNGYQSTMSNRHKDWLVQEQTALDSALTLDIHSQCSHIVDLDLSSSYCLYNGYIDPHKDYNCASDGGSTRCRECRWQYEVGGGWPISADTCPNRVIPRVPGMCQSKVVVWRSKAIMRRLVESKKTMIPSEFALRRVRMT